MHTMLKAAMTALHSRSPSNAAYQPVHTFPLNPKSIQMGELFGEYSSLTGEWRDGIASQLIREAVLDESMDRKWIVFDGPVDALWIENMNTVRPVA